MELKKLSVGEAIRTGWDRFKKYPLVWIAAVLILGLLSLSHNYISSRISDTYGITEEKVRIAVEESQAELENDEDITTPEQADVQKAAALQGLTALFYFLINSGLSAGLAWLAIKSVDHADPKIGDLFSRFKYTFHVAIAQILYSLIVFVGLLLLIVPGVMWALRYSLYTYFIAEKGVGPIQALKMSGETTQGSKWDLFGLAIASILIVIAGALLLGFGLLVAIPIVVIAWAFAYRILYVKEPQAIVQPREMDVGSRPMQTPPTTPTA